MISEMHFIEKKIEAEKALRERYAIWLQPLSSSISGWVSSLFPRDIPRQPLLNAAAIIGASRRDLVCGQVQYYWADNKTIVMRLKQPKVAQMLDDFGTYLYMNSRAGIVRTAIMAGLPLPRIEYGVMSPTRKEPFTKMEMQTMQKKAQEILDEYVVRPE